MMKSVHVSLKHYIIAHTIYDTKSFGLQCPLLGKLCLLVQATIYNCNCPFKTLKYVHFSSSENTTLFLNFTA